MVPGCGNIPLHYEKTNTRKFFHWTEQGKFQTDSTLDRRRSHRTKKNVYSLSSGSMEEEKKKEK